MSRQFDAIIIGTGQAGPSLAARFADAGLAVAIIERHKFGGTCVNTGCIPTKTLVASAYAAHVARRGDVYHFRPIAVLPRACRCSEGPPEVVGTHVLLAVGHTPNTSDLGLDRAGVATDPRGYIVVDDQLQTNYPVSGPSVTATAAAPLRILHTTTMRSSPIISSTQAIAASQTESRRTHCSQIRRLADAA